MASSDDIKLFISEAEDLINKVEEEILNLEENPTNNKPIQELYFGFHTLKGLTAMVGLENVSKFCHNFENLLDKSKDKKLTERKAAEIVDLMFQSLDVLKKVLKNAEAGKITDIDDKIIRELREGFEEVESAYDITFIKSINPKQVKEITSNKKNNFYKISIRLQSTCVFKKVRSFIIFRALNDIGQICWSNPEPHTLEAGDIDLEFDVFYISEKVSANITKVLNEILEIENKVIKKLSLKEFNPILEKSASKWEDQKTESRPVKRASNKKTDEKIEQMDGVMDLIKSFEEDTGQITSVKVKIETLEELMDYFGEVIILKNQLNQILSEKGDWGVTRFFDSMDKLFLEIQEIIFRLKLVRVESTFRRYKRLVRDVSKETNKNIRFLLEGTDVELDRKILEELNSPLIHLIRNAIYHGIETPEERRVSGKSGMGTLKLRSVRRAGSVNIEVIDDGKGIDYGKIKEKLLNSGDYSPEEVSELSTQELNSIIFAPGFSTLSGANMISGRGMGLAIVAEKIKEIGGSVELVSEKGKGTTFILTVPFSRAILKAQLFKVAGDLYAIPIENIEQIYFFNKNQIEYVKGEEYYRIEKRLIPVIRFRKFLDIINIDGSIAENKSTDGPAENVENLEINKAKEMIPSVSSERIAILCNKDEKNSAIFLVDEIMHQMDVVIKPFRSRYSEFKEVLGVSIIGDGSICLVVDVVNIISNLTKEMKTLQSIDISN